MFNNIPNRHIGRCEFIYLHIDALDCSQKWPPQVTFFRSPLKRDNMVTRWPHGAAFFVYLGSVVVRVGRIGDTIVKCFLSNFEILQLGSPKKGLNWYTSCVLWWLAERQCTKMCSVVVASNWRISIHDCSSSGCTFSFDPDSSSIFCSQLKVGRHLWATRNGTMRFVNPFCTGKLQRCRMNHF